ncbi:MAG: hypothetical protein K5745_01940 [Saccharofermentans sp.]|nr:hypothetical protein [Saccharofermentans sp.]
MSDIKKTLGEVLRLRAAIRYNGLVFKLRNTPVIGSIIPDSLYKSYALKALFRVVLFIRELMALFIGHFVLFSIVYLMALILNGVYEKDYSMVAYHLFLVYFTGEMFFGLDMFKCTTEKEYMVFMLRMKADKLNITLFIYNLARLFIGSMLAMIVAIPLGGKPWCYLVIPFLAVATVVATTGIHAAIYAGRFKKNKPMRVTTAGLVVRIFVFAGVFLGSIIIMMNGFFLPLPAIILTMLLIIALGIIGFACLRRFDGTLHRKALAEEKNGRILYENKYKHPDKSRQYKKIDHKAKVKGDRKGFEFLNQAFIQRHKSMLIAPGILLTCVIVFIIALTVFVYVHGYITDFGKEQAGSMVRKNIVNLLLFKGFEDPSVEPHEQVFAFFMRWLASSHLLLLLIPMLIIDRTRKITQAMYINCDMGLMTYNFFKKPELILKLFDIRLKQMIKINLIPAVAIGLFMNMYLFYTGGQEYPLQYIFTILVPVLMSAIYSVLYLAFYYLFQPFTSAAEVKGGAYNITFWGVVILLLGISVIPANAAVICLLLGIVFASLVFFMRKQVFKYSPKTWRVKS